jgi:hypothetical protein
MVCDKCGERTQRETIIVMRRGFGKPRATTLQAWYCFACKSSRSPGAEPAVPPAAFCPPRPAHV